MNGAARLTEPHQRATPEGRCQIYLVLDPGAGARERLSAILASTPIAVVLIKLRKASSEDIAAAKALIEHCQRLGIAALVEGDAALARSLRADGVHLPWSEALRARYDEAREILGNRYTVGVGIAPDTAAARHDAMELAEAGADYIGIEPGDDHAGFVAWWAQIFEVPCVAFDFDSAEAAGQIAVSGPEFIGITVPPGASPAECAARVAGLAAAADAAYRAEPRP